jgi:uncharacterized protein
MLIDFSVTNYGMVLEQQTLSMLAATAHNELPGNTFAMQPEKGPHLLKAASLYGPNASGKSTLIKALNFMKDCVLTSHTETQRDEPIDVQPFKLTAESRAADSEFEVNLVEGGVRYQYGFKCNQERFTEEWLFAFPKGRPQKWFHRVFDVKNKKDEYKFSPLFESESRYHAWQADTRPNALFLSKAIHSNSDQLLPVFNWFKQRLRIIGLNRRGLVGYTLKECDDHRKKQRIIDFIAAADIPIVDIEIERKIIELNDLPKGMPDEVREDFVKKVNEGGGMAEVIFIHQDSKTKERINFDLDEESEGTQRLFALAGPFLDIIDTNRILVIDEIDSSLHPMLVHQLVAEFHRLSDKQAQLIFTAHDTSLLNLDLLRRDQMWLFKRNAQQASEWYSVSDFGGVRKDESIERKYLGGRYGAIPVLKRMDVLHGE